MELLKKANENLFRSEKEIDKMIIEAAKHYGKFLEAMGFDYKADPQTIDTPLRVSKAWLKDLIVGSVSEPPEIKVFPNEDNYDGIIIQTGIRVNSLCAHHNLPFYGYATIAYIPDSDKVIGLSKLNRILDFYARRPQLQESLTNQVHTFISDKLGCKSVAVSVSSKHMCCGTRGIKHPESIMTTNKFSGVFMEPGNMVREELLSSIAKNGCNF